MFNTKYNNIVTASTQRDSVDFKFGLSKTTKPCVAVIFLIETQYENDQSYEQSATKEIKYCIDDNNKMIFEIPEGTSENISLNDCSCDLTNKNGELLLEAAINDEIFQVRIDAAEASIPY